MAIKPRAMDDKTLPSSLYITRKYNYHTNVNIGNLDDVGNDSPQWGEDVVINELMNMGTTNVHDAKDHNVTDVGD